MKVVNVKKLTSKQLIVFDLDGTLAATKAPMDSEMAELIARLLEVKKVAIIGGGKYGIFKTQFLQPLKVSPGLLQKLFLFPASSTSFYRYQKGWKKIYALELSKNEKNDISLAFKEVF